MKTTNRARIEPTKSARNPQDTTRPAARGPLPEARRTAPRAQRPIDPVALGISAVLSKRAMAQLTRTCGELEIDLAAGLAAAIGAFSKLAQINRFTAETGAMGVEDQSHAEEQMGSAEGERLFAQVMKSAACDPNPSKRFETMCGLLDLIRFNPCFTQQCEDLQTLLQAETQLAGYIEDKTANLRPAGMLKSVRGLHQ